MEHTRLQILGQHLSSLQSNLNAYEAKLLSNDRSSFVKAMVDYYREEAKLVSRYIMGLVKVTSTRDQEPTPVPAPAPVEVTKPEPVVEVTTTADPTSDYVVMDDSEEEVEDPEVSTPDSF